MPAKTVTNNKTLRTRTSERPSETPDLIPGYFAHIDKGKLLTHAEEIDLSRGPSPEIRVPGRGSSRRTSGSW
ncbi:MAG TPA: hypothetical protein VKA73_05135 [Rubrobacter sp.]|nr:hypothetical protein [Rubrobacter sp.]